MKYSPAIISAILFLLCSCSKQPQEAEIVIKEDGKTASVIRITVEGGEEVVIDDPYADEINALKAYAQEKRSHFLENRDAMTSEERKAFGEYRDKAGARIRELQKLQNSYIRARMKEVDGISFKLEASDFNQAVGSASEYLKGLEDSQ